MFIVRRPYPSWIARAGMHGGRAATVPFMALLENSYRS
jgi:hypothetical protein